MTDLTNIDLRFLAEQQKRMTGDVNQMRQEMVQLRQYTVQNLTHLQDYVRLLPTQIDLDRAVTTLDQKIDNTARGIVLDIGAMFDERFARMKTELVQELAPKA